MICLEKVTKLYGEKRFALSGCELTIGDESHAVIGSTGSGKTTLAKLICGIIRPTSGTVRLDGEAIDVNSASAETIGYMPYKYPAALSLSVSEELKYLAALRGLATEKVEAALNAVELESEERRLPASMLSPLSLKRATLALAILGGPRYVVLDQPLSGLESEDEERLRSLLLKLAESYVYIYLTDSLEEASLFCGTVTVLSVGRTVASCPISELGEDDEGPCVFRARVRGDKELIRSALDGESRIRKYTASVTALGSVILELVIDKKDGAMQLLSSIFSELGCSVTELKKVDSQLERVLKELRRNDEEKERLAKERESEKAPPVKLDASLISFRHSSDDEE